jgi:LPPG:FO 2-phospho-L-lactate transferase
LAGLSNPVTGWGRADESWQVLDALQVLGGPTWFRVGDRDLATHLERTRRLREGQALSQVTAAFCRAWGIALTVLPATDDSVPTWVYTEEGELPFQEYFVHRQCQPHVTGFRFGGLEVARPAPGVLESIHQADLVVICPSNPWVSVDPILAIPGLRQAIPGARQILSGGGKGPGKPVISVSPIIGGQTVKGPAAKMYAELGIQPSALAVARHYQGLLTGFVFDQVDADLADNVRALGITPFVTQTLMSGPIDRRRLAEDVLRFGLA